MYEYEVFIMSIVNEVIQFAILITALVSIPMLINQMRQQIKSDRFNFFNNIHRQEIENRQNLSKYQKELDNLLSVVKSNRMDRGTFVEELAKDDYKHLRQCIYFYEYLGSLVEYKAVDFRPLFALVNFPDKMYAVITDLKLLVRKKYEYPDFLIHIDTLYEKYEKERSKMKIENITDKYQNELNKLHKKRDEINAEIDFVFKKIDAEQKENSK